MENSTREQATDQHSADLTYEVLIKWNDLDFCIPIHIKARSLEEAARRRVGYLDHPDKYKAVLVRPLGKTGGVIYPVRDFLEPLTSTMFCSGTTMNVDELPWVPTPEEISQAEDCARMPQPRYGWRG